MGCCKTCSTCIAVAAFKNANKGDRHKKKVKWYKTTNACANPTATTRKIHLDEVEQLANVAVQGGQVRQVAKYVSK